MDPTVKQAFASGKEYVILYKDPCGYSSSALDLVPNERKATANITGRIDTVVKALRAEYPNSTDLKTHNTYPIVFKKSSDGTYEFVGGYTELSNTYQAVMMGGGYDIEKITLQLKKIRYVLI